MFANKEEAIGLYLYLPLSRERPNGKSLRVDE